MNHIVGHTIANAIVSTFDATARAEQQPADHHHDRNDVVEDRVCGRFLPPVRFVDLRQDRPVHDASDRNAEQRRQAHRSPYPAGLVGCRISWAAVTPLRMLL